MRTISFLLLIFGFGYRVCGQSPTSLPPAGRSPVAGGNPLADSCRQLPVWKYNTRMTFYFPVDSAHKRTRNAMAGYSRAPASGPQNFIKDTVGYDLLAGKTFILATINRYPVYTPWRELHEWLEFKLVSAGVVVYFTFPQDAFFLSQTESSNGQDQSLSLTAAVSMDAVADFKNQVGNTYYTRFPVKVAGAHGVYNRKYLRVQISRVEAGTWSAPVRVFYKGDSVPEQSIDVVTCGTNTLPAFITHNRVADLFQVQDQQELFRNARAKLQSKTSTSDKALLDHTWEMICKDSVEVGMTGQEVIMALGRPSKISSATGAMGRSEIYKYDKQLVYLDGDRVTKVEVP